MMQLLGWLMLMMTVGMSVATLVIRYRARHEPGYQDGVSAAVITGLLATLTLVGGLIVLHALSLLPVIVVGVLMVTVILPYVWRRSRRSLYPRDREE